MTKTIMVSVVTMADHFLKASPVPQVQYHVIININVITVCARDMISASNIYITPYLSVCSR